MCAKDYQLLVELSGEFSNIEMIAIRLDNYLPIEIPSSKGCGNLTSEILAFALRVYNTTEGEISIKYQAFLLEIINKIRVVLLFGVSSANKRDIHSRGIYWDCFQESYSEWATKNEVTEPMIEKSNYVISSQSLVVGLVLASFVLNRNDWSFIGVPHPGVERVPGSSELDKLLTNELVA